MSERVNKQINQAITCERREARKRSEQSGASESSSDVNKRANGRASVPVLTSRFMPLLNHGATDGWTDTTTYRDA